MDRVVVDPVERTATVGAGVRWRDVQEEAAEFGLFGLAGSSSDVGVVGYTLGGGHGPFVRTFGWAADRVRRLTVVTGDGRIHEVTPASELFHAVLGSKDVVGIVTGMEFELVELSTFYGGSIFYDAADAPAVLRAYRGWASSLDADTTTSVAILRLPDLEMLPPVLRGRCVVQLRVAHVGEESEGAARVAAMRGVATPLLDSVGVMPAAAADYVHLDPPEPMPSWETGSYLSSFEPETVERLLDVAGPEHDLPVIAVEIRHLDDPDARPGTGCVGHAGARWSLGVVAPMVPDLRDVVPAVGLSLLDAVSRWSTGLTPANWISPETAAARPGTAWTAADRAWLAELVARHDPAGVLGAHRYGL